MRWLENGWFAAKEESLNTIKWWKGCRDTRNEAVIVPDINDHVAAGYDKKVYIGKVLGIDDFDAKISFYEHTGTLSTAQFTASPKIEMKFELIS